MKLILQKIKPSKRGELETTDINNMFKNNNLELIKLNFQIFGQIQELIVLY